MHDPKPKKRPAPITEQPSRLPERKRKATPGFGEDGTGKRVSKHIRRDVEKPTVQNES